MKGEISVVTWRQDDRLPLVGVILTNYMGKSFEVIKVHKKELTLKQLN
ncbi:hypothetical protein [Dehalococcoides sp. THU4]